MKQRKKFAQLKTPEGVWQYHVGKTHVLLYSPDGTRYLQTHVDVTKFTNYAEVNQTAIKAWIENQVLTR